MKTLLMGAILLVPVAHCGCEASQDERLEPVVQLGHTRAMRTLRFSAGGRWLITSAHDGRVLQWDAERGNLVRSFAASGFEVGPDGRSMLVLVRQGAAITPTWIDLDTGRVMQRVDEAAHAPAFQAASLTIDGRYALLLAGGGRDLLERLWLWDCRAERFAWRPGMPLPFETQDDEGHADFAEGNAWVTQYLQADRRAVLFCRSVRPDGRLLATQSPVGDIAFTPDGRHMLTRHWDDTGSATDVTLLWDIESAEPLATFFEPFAEPQPFCYSPDGRLFVRGIGHPTAAICEVATGKTRHALEGHEGKITSLAFSPDGKTVLTGSREDSVIFWDAATGRRLRQVTVRGGVRSLAYAPDGERLLVGTWGCVAVLYDTGSGAIVGSFGDVPIERSRAGVIAAFDPTGRRVVTRTQGGHWRQTEAALWDAETFGRLRPLCVPYLDPITLSPDGAWALAWHRGADSGLLLWNLKTAEVVHRFDDHLSGPQFLFWDDKDEWPSTAGDGALRGWRERHGGARSQTRIAFPREFREVVPTLGLSAEAADWIEGFLLRTSERWPLHSGPATDRVISSDGSRGATWRRAPTHDATSVTIHDLEENSVLRELTVPGHSMIRAAFSPDASRILVGAMSKSWKAMASLWEVSSGKSLWSIDDVFGKQGLQIEHITFSPDGRYVVLATSFHRTALVLDARKAAKRFKTDGRPEFGPHAKRALFFGNRHALWDVESATMLHDFGQHRPIDRFVFSPGGNTLWVRGRHTGLYSAASGALLHETGDLVSAFNDKTFGLDGTRFVTRSRRVRTPETVLWDFETGNRVAELVGPDGLASSNATFTPDGRNLVTILSREVATAAEPSGESPSAPSSPRRYQTGLLVWDAETGKRLSCEMADVGLTVNTPDRLMFLPDGRHCLTVHADAVVLWKIESGLPVHVFRESGPLAAVDLAPDGRSLLVILADRGATLWDLPARKKVRSFGRLPTFGHVQPSTFWRADSRFSADGRRIITTSHDGRGVHQLDVATGRVVGSFYLLGDGGDAVTFTPGGRFAATSPALVSYRKPGTNTLAPIDGTR